MSGRLIILPKKSWHPGKRENIEKVLRDERLAAEEAASARERAREIAQEGIVETLSKKRSAAATKHAETKEGQGKVAEKPASQKRKRKRQGEDEETRALGGKGQGWGETPQHVNLFSEAEREAGKLLGQNADHEREKREQELTAQRRSGLAPTALGEGASELMGKDSQPWYTHVGATSASPKVVARAVRLGREVTGQEAEAVMKRDQGRKGRADPMGTLFRPSAPPTTEIIFPGGLPSGATGAAVKLKEGALGVSDSAAGEMNETTIRTDGKTGSKKRKKDKKHKKRSTKGERKRSRRDSRVGGSAEANDPRYETDEAKDVARQQALEELRRKRLVRERGERNRQTRLLAEREMAGQSLPDERSMAYNNQYNAPAARQNRGHERHARYQRL